MKEIKTFEDLLNALKKINICDKKQIIERYYNKFYIYFTIKEVYFKVLKFKNEKEFYLTLDKVDRGYDYDGADEEEVTKSENPHKIYNLIKSIKQCEEE
ncbi:MAG: hypothetical protein BV457_00075 [Thermoplasmata archaeon M9B1D]|nr:MAG: hypothetical protein BV457_00075 [Thermoplasmata archaeon M9B1D]PNX52239.1 MAG: hypothetical protein BV456_00220 [Thermoplasmata archaeon M8B2D]